MMVYRFRGVGRANYASNVGNASNANNVYGVGAPNTSMNIAIRALPKGKTSSESSRLSRKSKRETKEMQT